MGPSSHLGHKQTFLKFMEKQDKKTDNALIYTSAIAQFCFLYKIQPI